MPCSWATSCWSADGTLSGSQRERRSDIRRAVASRLDRRLRKSIRCMPNPMGVAAEIVASNRRVRPVHRVPPTEPVRLRRSSSEPTHPGRSAAHGLGRPTAAPIAPWSRRREVAPQPPTGTRSLWRSGSGLLLFLKQSLTDFVEMDGDERANTARRGHLLLPMNFEVSLQIFGDEGTLSCQHRIQNDAQRVQIRPRIDRFPFALLGRRTPMFLPRWCCRHGDRVPSPGL